jgi:hypothetical protein
MPRRGHEAPGIARSYDRHAMKETAMVRVRGPQSHPWLVMCFWAESPQHVVSPRPHHVGQQCGSVRCLFRPV